MKLICVNPECPNRAGFEGESADLICPKCESQLKIFNPNLGTTITWEPEKEKPSKGKK